MAFRSVVGTALLFVLVLVQADLSFALLLKGSVSCVDCSHLQNLAGLRVAVKCNSDNRHTAFAMTDDKGHFEAEMPRVTSAVCHAVLLGGPEQLCSFKKALKSRIVRMQGSIDEYYTISTPLSFFSSCDTRDLQPLRKWSSSNAGDKSFRSSKTVDIPLPPEWGLAPSSYYFPFIPIIGIP